MLAGRGNILGLSRLAHPLFEPAMSHFTNTQTANPELLQAYEALDEDAIGRLVKSGSKLSVGDFYFGTTTFMNKGMTPQFNRIALRNASHWDDKLHYVQTGRNIVWWLAANSRLNHHWETPHWRAVFAFLKETGRLNDAIFPFRNADIDKKFGPGSGWRLLHAAIAADNDSLAIWLVSNGASPDGHAKPNLARSDGTRESDLSASDPHLLAARTARMDQTPLQLAAARGRRRVVDALLAAGADPAKRGYAESTGHREILARHVFQNPAQATLANAIEAMRDAPRQNLPLPDASLCSATLALALGFCNTQERHLPWAAKLLRGRSWSALRSAAQAFDWPSCETHCSKLGSATLHGLSPAAFAMAACAEGFDEAGSGLSSMGWRERCQALGAALSAQSASRHCPAWRSSCAHAAAALLGPSARAPWIRSWAAVSHGADTPLEWAMRSEAPPSLDEVDAAALSPQSAPNALAAAIAYGLDALAAGLCTRGWRLAASFHAGQSAMAIAHRELATHKFLPGESPRIPLIEAILAQDERSEISSSCPTPATAPAFKPRSL